MTVLLPKRIGSVRVLERLGEGGMAYVHRAEDVYRPELLLALKFLRAEVSADSDLVRRFLREGEVLKRIRHPNLVEVHDFGRAGSVPYILMELLPGGTFKQCRGECPARICARLRPVAEALIAAHASGVIHRDLKPSNLLFAPDGRLKVTDFGVCLWEGGEGTRATRSQMVVGTLGYMSPEQHGDPRKVDARCDVYALSAILYEFTTGQAYSQVQLPPAAVRPGFPPRLARIIMQALAPDPAKRTPSMEVFAQELGDWLGSAEAAGWGAEPLPGFSPAELETATVSQYKPRKDQPSSEERLLPYLDALRTGDVGSRRAAADGLVRSVIAEDERFLLEALERVPDSARFALASALGGAGGPAALPSLLKLLEDPFARSEAAEAASLIALRNDMQADVREKLREVGLGSPWRWRPRARLGDESWVRALEEAWTTLAIPMRIQALEAARELPSELRARVKGFSRSMAEQNRGLQGAWKNL